MITFQNVTKQYGAGDPVLSDVSFAIDKGSFAYIVGPTGSGKTTIFRLIIGDLTPSDGNIILGELNLADLPKSKIPNLRRKVGVVFQDLKLLMDRTVAENIMLPLSMAGESDHTAREKAEEILISVGLAGKGDKFPRELSGGERQRVAIARALIFNPEIILADEPTGNLDQKTSFQILDLLKEINKKLGTTIFMATHNDVLIKSDDRVIVLEDGKVKEDKKGKKHTTASAESSGESKEDKKQKNEDSEEKTDKNDEKKSHDKEKEEEKEDKNEEKEDEGKEKINLEQLAEPHGKD